MQKNWTVTSRWARHSVQAAVPLSWIGAAARRGPTHPPPVWDVGMGGQVGSPLSPQESSKAQDVVLQGGRLTAWGAFLEEPQQLCLGAVGRRGYRWGEGLLAGGGGGLQDAPRMLASFSWPRQWLHKYWFYKYLLNCMDLCTFMYVVLYYNVKKMLKIITEHKSIRASPFPAS